MMDTGTLAPGPYRIRGVVRKFDGDDQTGEPFEEVTVAQWFEPNGQRITDPVRCAALDAHLAEKDGS